MRGVAASRPATAGRTCFHSAAKYSRAASLSSPRQPRHRALAFARHDRPAVGDELVIERSGSRDHGPRDGAASKPGSRAQHRRAGCEPPMLDPNRTPVAQHAHVEPGVAVPVAFARTRAGKAEDVPGDQARIAAKFRFPADVGEGAVVEDGFLRQPFDARPGFRLYRNMLPRPCPRRPVPLARTRRRQQDVGAIARMHAQFQFIAAGNSRRRMHDDGVAHGLALGMQRLLDDERAVVSTGRQDGATFAPYESELKARAPAGGRVEVIPAHGPIILRAVAARRPSPCRRPRRAR